MLCFSYSILARIFSLLQYNLTADLRILPFAVLDILGTEMFPYLLQNAPTFASSEHFIGGIHNIRSIRSRYVYT